MTHAKEKTVGVLTRVDGAARSEVRKFTRLDAVERQLDMAIRAHLQFDDLVSAMTLAGAAERVLSDLQPQDGILGVDAWSIQSLVNLYFKDEFHNLVRDKLRHAYDFLRHADGKKGADKGPNDSLALHQGTVDFFLMLAIKAFQSLQGNESPTMRAFGYWLIMEHPGWLRAEEDERGQWAGVRSSFPNLTKADRFAALLAVIKSQSPIPNPQSPL
ncbi:MAG: hypothetical protein HXY23_06990 [Parvularculaceae bacterium]|nr:hypothetical protein [Parvularculaceae bacterium]